MEQRPHQLESDEDQAEGMTIQLGPVEYSKIWGGTINKWVAYFYLCSVSTSATVKVGHLSPKAHQFRWHCTNPKTNLLIENGHRSLYDHTNETILFISIRMSKYHDQPKATSEVPLGHQFLIKLQAVQWSIRGQAAISQTTDSP